MDEQTVMCCASVASGNADGRVFLGWAGRASRHQCPISASSLFPGPSSTRTMSAYLTLRYSTRHDRKPAFGFGVCRNLEVHASALTLLLHNITEMTAVGSSSAGHVPQPHCGPKPGPQRLDSTSIQRLVEQVSPPTWKGC